MNNRENINYENLVFEYWKGQNYFFFSGYIMTGPNGVKPILLTNCMITTPSLIFIITFFNWIKDTYSIYINIIPILIVLLVYFFAMMTCFSDPGIIQENRIYEIKKKKFILNRLGFMQKFKICTTCFIVVPPRSNHCRDCNNCVEKFDHHCPWLGNCIAKRNYKFFYCFLLHLNFLVFYMIIMSSIYLSKSTKFFATYEQTKLYLNSEDLKISSLLHDYIGKMVVAIFTLIFCFFSSIFVTGLLGYHTILILKNSTTKEDLKNLFRTVASNPYTRGFNKNITIAFCPKFLDNSILFKLREKVKTLKNFNYMDNNNFEKKQQTNIELSMKENHNNDKKSSTKSSETNGRNLVKPYIITDKEKNNIILNNNLSDNNVNNESERKKLMVTNDLSNFENKSDLFVHNLENLHKDNLNRDEKFDQIVFDQKALTFKSVINDAVIIPDKNSFKINKIIQNDNLSHNDNIQESDKKNKRLEVISKGINLKGTDEHVILDLDDVIIESEDDKCRNRKVKFFNGNNQKINLDANLCKNYQKDISEMTVNTLNQLDEDNEIKKIDDINKLEYNVNPFNKDSEKIEEIELKKKSSEDFDLNDKILKNALSLNLNNINEENMNFNKTNFFKRKTKSNLRLTKIKSQEINGKDIKNEIDNFEKLKKDKCYENADISAIAECNLENDGIRERVNKISDYIHKKSSFLDKK